MNTKLFCTLCKGFQLAPCYVVQQFAGTVSIYSFLDQRASPLTTLASRIFLNFHKQEPAFTETNECKRQRGIENIRSILQLLLSGAGHQTIYRQCSHITKKWYRANELHGAGSILSLPGELSVRLSFDFILHSDLLHYNPKDLLCYFIQQAAREAQMPGPQQKAFCLDFLKECTATLYAVENN